MGNDAKVSAVAVGDLELSSDYNKILILKDYLYLYSIKRNIVLVSNLVHFGYSVYFNDFMLIRRNKYFIYPSLLVDNLHIINYVSPILQLSKMNNTISLSSKREELLKMNQMYLWYLRLGHINLRRIQRLVKNGPLSSLKVDFVRFLSFCFSLVNTCNLQGRGELSQREISFFFSSSIYFLFFL